jgi:hypothetical protein
MKIYKMNRHPLLEVQTLAKPVVMTQDDEWSELDLGTLE